MEQRIRSALASRGLVVFAVGEEALGAPVEEVAGMLDADHLAPLPGRVAPMAGVVAFRGSVVPTLDLAAALGVEDSSKAPHYAVVLERGTDRFALLVRGMPRLHPARDIVECQVTTPPSVAGMPGRAAGPAADEGADGTPAVLGTYEIGGRDVRYLDYWSLMDSVAPPAAFRLSGLGGR